MSQDAIRLDQTQKRVLASLRKRLLDQLDQLHKIKALKYTEKASALRRRYDYSNVFGILGPRGAGKSTLLYNLPYRDGKSSEFHVLDPLDCSTIPQGVEPGLAILIHLQKALKKWVDKPQDPKKKEQLENCLSCLKEDLLPIYIRLHKFYQELRLDLASSTQRLSEDLVSDASARLDFSESLASFLHTLSKKQGFKVLIVPLDDFDLVPARYIRKWIQSLLDELHQPRLFFVITADFYRLQHIAWDPKDEYDDKTGRRLLDKILSWQNRFNVSPWQQENRRDFIHYPMATKEDEGSAEGSKAMQSLLKEVVDVPDFFESLLVQLLPSLPRGLTTIYDTLAFWNRELEEWEKDHRPLLDFLPLLATGRSEPLLARALSEYSLDDWEELLVFSDKSLLPEGWRETVRIAQQRPELQRGIKIPSIPYKKGLGGRTEGKDFCEPLHGLKVVSLLPHEDPRQSKRRRTVPEVLNRPGETYGSNRVIIDSTGNEAVRDPLRHQDLWEHPLRDASVEAQPFWAEILLTASFSQILGVGEDRAARNRVSFLEKWRPAASRLKGCRVEARILSDEIRHFFTDYGEQKLLPLLYWVRWRKLDHQGRPSPQIGWSPLLSALRQNRDPLQLEVLSSELSINVRQLRGALPPTEPGKALGLIPDQVWAIILLVDGLNQCPWSAFSSRLGWSLATHLLLAGALVHGAYLYAMQQAGLLKDLPEGTLGREQESLLAAFEARRIASFFMVGDGELNQKGKVREELSDQANVFARLAAIVKAPLPTGEDPLGRAADSFQKLEPYVALQGIATKGWLYDSR